MKTSCQLIVIFLLLMATACGDSSSSGEGEGATGPTAGQPIESTGEYFADFFEDFMNNHSFQSNRIAWPLEYVSWKGGESGSELDTILINKEDWQHEAFYKSMHIRSQLYDNFNRKLKDTDERVFTWRGPSGGIEINFYFQRREGKWYMIRKEDLSG